MKKYLKWILVLVMIAGIFIYKEKANSSTSYFFYDNENGFFDEIYEFMDREGLAPSNEKLNAIRGIDGVEGIYPSFYLEMRTFEEDYQDEIIELKTMVDGKETIFTLPYKTEVLYENGSEPEKVTYFDVNLSNYGNEEYVVNQMVSHNDGPLANEGYRVTKTLEANTGIYISSVLFEALGGDLNAKSLSITLPLYVPSKMTIDLVHHQTPMDEYGIPLTEDEYDFFAESQTVTGYQMVEYTFEVEGVIDHYGLWLYYPIEMNESILDSVDLEKVELEENEVYYQPNVYQIKLEKAKTMKSLGKKLDKVIDNFALGHTFFNHMIESYHNH